MVAFFMGVEMKIAVLQTNTILSSWTNLAVAQELRLMGHDVVQGLVPVNEFGQVRTVFRPAEWARVEASFPTFDELKSCDIVWCIAPEYYPQYIEELYPRWGELKTRVASLVESSKRGMPLRTAFTHKLVVDPEDDGYYLKPCVDTRRFCPDSNTPKTWEVGFIGTLYEKRVDFLNQLLPLIPGVDFQCGAVNMRDLDGERQEDWADAMVNNIRRLKIHVNLPSNNPMTCARPLETMACGALCLTYKPNDYLFGDGLHYRTYETYDECARYIKYYLQNPDRAAELAKTGMEYVREKFSLKSRLEEVLTYVVG